MHFCYLLARGEGSQYILTDYYRFLGSTSFETH